MLDSHSPSALVVDDDRMILMDVCDMLAEAGFRALEAENVAEAIDLLEAHAGEISLLFTDVQMPGGRDGFDLARETAGRWPEVNILVASGNMKPRDEDLPPHAAFIGKPFSANIVYARLQELLPDGDKPEPLKRRATRQGIED